MELAEARDRAASKSAAFLSVIPEDFDITKTPYPQTYGSALSQTRQLETERRRARKKVSELENEVAEIELWLHIEKRWDATTLEYCKTIQYIQERQYRLALEDVQKLIVQRLFELHRLNLSSIVLALGRTNTLDFARAAQFNFVEEFELLKNSHADLAAACWKEPQICEAMKRHQRIKRAHEELEQLDVEIARVYSAILAEHEHFKKVLHRLKTANDPLHAVVHDFCLRRTRVNHVVLSKLHDTVSLPGYTGAGLQRGRQKGDSIVPQDGMELESTLLEGMASNTGGDIDGEGDDDESEAQIGGIVDFISVLSTG